MGNCCGNSEVSINTKDQLFLNRSVARFNVIRDIKTKTNSKLLLKTSNVKRIKPKNNSELSYNEDIDTNHYFQQIINFYVNKYNNCNNTSDFYNEDDKINTNMIYIKSNESNINKKVVEKINLETIWNIVKKENYNNTNSKYVIFSLIKNSNNQFNYLKQFQYVSYTIEEIAGFSNEKLLKFKKFINGKVLLVIVNQETNFNTLDLLYEIHTTNNFNCCFKIVNYNFLEFETGNTLMIHKNHKENKEYDNIGHFINRQNSMSKHSMSARNLHSIDNFSIFNQSILSTINENANDNNNINNNTNRSNLIGIENKEFILNFETKANKESINSFNNKFNSEYSLVDEIKNTNLNINTIQSNNKNTSVYKNNIVKEFLNDNLDLFEFSKMPYILGNLNYFKNLNTKSFIFTDFINESNMINENKPDIIRTIFNKKLIKKLLSDKDIINNKLIRFVNFFKLTGVLVIRSNNLKEDKDINFRSFYQNGEFLMKIISNVKYLDDLNENMTELINSLLLYRNLINQHNSIIIYFDDSIKPDTVVYLMCIIMFFLTDTTPRNLISFNDSSFTFIDSFFTILNSKLVE